MTRNQVESWFSYTASLVALGFAGAAASAVMAPQLYAPALAATGGVMLGSHAALERRRRKNSTADEAAKVGKVFSILYEVNKGVVSPEQLGYHSEIDIAKADRFLSALCTQQGGQRIQTETGLLYSFPHTENALDELNKKAAIWADQQTDPILRENAQLKQAVTALQNMLRASSKPPELQEVDNPARLKKDKEGENPWGNLL